ncbi:MAG TPA: YbaK/EbsC family protein [Ktedonobacteraceae bacterium]|nr:YbaK/EbsC family protein [Ktedonobacteraceae bacterium]
MSNTLGASVQKVQDVLKSLGFTGEVVVFPDSTRTAAEAAQAVGCDVGQIVKSLVFRGKHTGKPVLVEASGANRVNERHVGEMLGEPIEKADADFVRQHTGFAVGGVPPVGHAGPIATFIDEDLLQYQEIWAAAGNPHAVFRLTPGELQALTGGKVITIT